MKTAISVPDADFERYERVAGMHAMTRSEFYQLAAKNLADSLEGTPELTAIADAVLARAETSPGDDLFVRESERVMVEGTEW